MYELSWKTLRDLLNEKGYVNTFGPQPVIEQSLQDGYLADRKGRMQMQKKPDRVQ